jgi:hypothetical protein
MEELASDNVNEFLFVTASLPINRGLGRSHKSTFDYLNSTAYLATHNILSTAFTSSAVSFQLPAATLLDT